MAGSDKQYQLFDALRPEEMDALEADILKRGIMVPIEMDDKGHILDGHHRAAIAKKHGLKYKTVIRKFANETEKKEHVFKMNLLRRHLDPLAWGKAFKKLLKLLGVRRGKGRQKKTPTKGVIDAKSVATELGVSPRTAEKRLKLADDYDGLTPAEQKKVDAGKSTVSQARRAVQREVNRKKAKRTPPPDPKKLVLAQAIIIDPPWDVRDEDDKNPMGRANPDYATMPIADIAALPVAKLADKNCHLYLWITNRSLPKGFALLDAWGFRYITTITWCKPSIGVGNYFRNNTEHVLFGVKGTLSLLRQDVATWFKAKRGKGHSTKPVEFYELVESCSPGPRLEMFARRKRPGWMSWGADV